MLDLHLLSKARALCFTFSSNFGRLAMYMNPMHLIPIREDHTVSGIPMNDITMPSVLAFSLFISEVVIRAFWSSWPWTKTKYRQHIVILQRDAASFPQFLRAERETYWCCKVRQIQIISIRDRTNAI